MALVLNRGYQINSFETPPFAFRGEGGGQSLRLFLTTGILGGFMTFSTFTLETALFWQRGQVLGTAGYVGGAVLAGVLGLFGGLALVRGFTP